jgi:hypothetical protein
MDGMEVVHTKRCTVKEVSMGFCLNVRECEAESKMLFVSNLDFTLDRNQLVSGCRFDVQFYLYPQSEKTILSTKPTDRKNKNSQCFD